MGPNARWLSQNRCLPVLLLFGQILIEDLPYFFIPRSGLFQKLCAGSGSGQLAVRAEKGNGAVQLFSLGPVLGRQRQRHHQGLALVFPGEIDFQPKAYHHGKACQQLGGPEPQRGHQHQAVGAQPLDPDAARAVPDEVAQGDVTVELPLFDVAQQQRRPPPDTRCSHTGRWGGRAGWGRWSSPWAP